MAKKGNKQTTSVVHQLVVKSPNRRTADIGTWKTALRSADGGRMKTLYDLYDDLLIDGVLSDAMQKRIDAVCNSSLTFTDADGCEVPEVLDLIDTIGFEEMLTEILKSRFYGRSGFEIELPAEGEFVVHPIPAKHIHLQNRVILLDDSDEKGIAYEDDPFVCVIGKERDFGIFLKTAPYVIYKRGGFGDWSQWLELFGMPQRIGKYSTYDPESRRLLEEAFDKAGSAPWLVIPKDSEVETLSARQGTGRTTAHNEFRQACNEEILITMLGQTMTTVQGEKGARSLGEVHKEVEEGKNLSDLRFVQRILNTYIRPMLAQRGFPTENGRFSFPDAAEALPLSDIVQLSDLIEIPAAYLHEKYAIPMPEEGEPIARRQQPSMGYDMGGLDLDAPPANEDEPIRNHDQKGFWARLRDFFVHAPQHWGATSGCVLTLQEGTTLTDRLIAGVANGQITKWSPELFEHLSQELVKGVQRVFQRPLNHTDVSFEYSGTDPAVQVAMELNLFRFSAGKTLAEVQALNEAFRQSSSYDEFYDKATRICTDFNEHWQRTEYETAVRVAEETANYHRLRSKGKLFPYWQYCTMGDDKVRSEHAELDGLVLHHTDKRWKEIYPPNGWGCRCHVKGLMEFEVDQSQLPAMRQQVDQFMETPPWQMAKAQGWNINRADKSEVFTANQQYIRKMPEKASKTISTLFHHDYDLPSFSKCCEQATAEMPAPYTGTPEDWYATHQTLTDYNGRSVQFTPAVFKSHTTGKHAQRNPMLSCLQDVLSNPDEVWYMHEKRYGESISHIKFYEDKVINVILEIVDGHSYQVKTWFEINKTPNLRKKPSPSERANDPRWKYRRGLLLKK
ncbi:MAG: DUF935 family protein [Bacteroidaceae bacterium]|nr:DUF935 family protein [Bacteroidaceae bacterium]